MNHRMIREIAQEVRHYARTLDPDLASMRSVSPSFAYRRQRDRLEVSWTNERRENFMQQLADYAKQNMFGG